MGDVGSKPRDLRNDRGYRVAYRTGSKCWSRSKDNAETQRNTEKHGDSSLLEDLFLAAEVTEAADVGDDEGDAELVVGADLAEFEAAIFESEATAAAVVAELDELILKSVVRNVIAHAGSNVESLAVFAAVSDQSANLI